MSNHYRRSVSVTPMAYLLLNKLTAEASCSGWVERAIRREAARQGITVSPEELMLALELADARKAKKRADALEAQNQAFPAAADLLL